MTNMTDCDKHKKRQETKNFYGDIEALADARRSLKNWEDVLVIIVKGCQLL